MRGFIFTESDAGSKRRAIVALQRTRKDLDLEFRIAAREYWWRVWQTARTLCLQYGAYDTGALYSSIRLLWETEPYGGLYEIAISSERGMEVTAMIKVGGMAAINPKTGWYVDYAQAVHDGTRYMTARPFLMDAIVLNDPFLQQILQRHVDKALSRFERDY